MITLWQFPKLLGFFSGKIYMKYFITSSEYFKPKKIIIKELKFLTYISSLEITSNWNFFKYSGAKT